MQIYPNEGDYLDALTPGAAFPPMRASQILRLRQHDPASRIVLDYGGRLSGLAVLVAIPQGVQSHFAATPRPQPMTLQLVALVTAFTGSSRERGRSLRIRKLIFRDDSLNIP